MPINIYIHVCACDLYGGINKSNKQKNTKIAASILPFSFAMEAHDAIITF